MVFPETERTSSLDSAPARSSPSSGGGSGGGRRGREGAGDGRSLSSEESWSEVGDDDIEPSDSASRSRQSSNRRHTVEARAPPSRRHSSRRGPPEQDDIPLRTHSNRRDSTNYHQPQRHDSRHDPRYSRRVPSDQSSSTVASADDYPPYGHHGAQRGAYPPQSGYRHVPAGGHGGYPPSMSSAGGYPDPYDPRHQALVHMQRQDPFGYPQQNPFAPYPQGPPNPFSPGNVESSNYFAADPLSPPPQHHRPPGRPRPQSFVAPQSHYNQEMVSPFNVSPAHYPSFGAPSFFPMPAYGWAPTQGGSPPPKDEKNPELEALKELIKQKQEDEVVQKKEKAAELDALKELMKKHEADRLASEKAWIAQREAEAAAKAVAKAKEEEAQRVKEEIAAASKKAKEDAEKKAEEAAKKAKEEHEKKLAEAQKAKEESEKKKKELEDEIAKNKPTPDSQKPPVRFKDAVGRKFSFPFAVCKTWKGMEGLIKQAFLHVDVIGDHVQQGHYDLTGPDGEIILPQVWETTVQPDWEITMHLWPMPEDKGRDKLAADAGMMGLDNPFAHLGLGDLGILPPRGGSKSSKKGNKGSGRSGKKKSNSADAVINVHPQAGRPGVIPAPPGFDDPFAGLGALSALGPEKESKSRSKSKSKNGKELTGLAAWFAGGSQSSKSKKK